MTFLFQKSIAIEANHAASAKNRHFTGCTCCIFIASLIATAIVCLPEKTHAAAWLLEEKRLALFITKRRKNIDTDQGIIQLKTRQEDIDFYAEYGLNEKLTLNGKYIDGKYDFGRGRIENSFHAEAGFRLDAKWARLDILPPGTLPLVNKLTPHHKPSGVQRASFETGLVHNSFNHTGLRLALAHGDKLWGIGSKDLTLQAELQNEIILWDNSDRVFKIHSRIQIGRNGYFIGYQRVDSLAESRFPYRENLWLWEIGLPVKSHTLRLSSGHDRLTNSYTSKSHTVGMQLQLSFKLQ